MSTQAYELLDAAAAAEKALETLVKLLESSDIQTRLQAAALILGHPLNK